LKNIIPPFNADRFLKSTISKSMWSDSNDFLWRVDVIKKNNETTSFSWISKLYIDLLMAIESDLKSLIISLSQKQEIPEKAYTVVRSKSHNIEQLYSEVEERAKNRIKLLDHKKKDELLNKAIKIKVSHRYKLISLISIRNENGSDRDFGFGEYSSILTYKYLSIIEKIALELHSIAKKSDEKYMPFIMMNGSNMKKHFGRIKEFENNLGKRL
jgi:hypothetical protein